MLIFPTVLSYLHTIRLHHHHHARSLSQCVGALVGSLFVSVWCRHISLGLPSSPTVKKEVAAASDVREKPLSQVVRPLVQRCANSSVRRRRPPSSRPGTPRGFSRTPCSSTVSSSSSAASSFVAFGSSLLLFREALTTLQNVYVTPHTLSRPSRQNPTPMRLPQVCAASPMTHTLTIRGLTAPICSKRAW